MPSTTTMLKHVVLAFAAIALTPSTLLANELILDKQKTIRKMQGNLNIASFNVSFMTSEAKSASTTNFDNVWGSKSSMDVRTVGLDRDKLQAMVDGAYADFLSKLEAAGFSYQTFDSVNLVPDYMRDSVRYGSNFAENKSHYHVHTKMTDITVTPTGLPALHHINSGWAGYAAKEQKTAAITMNYLIAPGYIETNAKKTRDEFMKEVRNKTSAVFHPGVQVFWHSGAEIWQSKNKKGQIKINTHIGAPDTSGGTLKVGSREEGFHRKSAVLEYHVNDNAYYRQALDVLKQANSRIVAAMKKAS